MLVGMTAARNASTRGEKMSSEAEPTGDVDDRTVVLSLLKMSGITPTEPEVDALVAGLPANRAMADLLYTMPGVRYEDPATTFDPRI
jgi:hypothetical protein